MAVAAPIPTAPKPEANEERDCSADPSGSCTKDLIAEGKEENAAPDLPAFSEMETTLLRASESDWTSALPVVLVSICKTSLSLAILKCQLE